MKNITMNYEMQLAVAHAVEDMFDTYHDPIKLEPLRNLVWWDLMALKSDVINHPKEFNAFLDEYLNSNFGRIQYVRGRHGGYIRK